jgi:hypothetical protein
MLTTRDRPDPAEWCPRGYAIVNVDIRGTWDSEGNLYIEGSQMGMMLFNIREKLQRLLTAGRFGRLRYCRTYRSPILVQWCC